MGRLLAAERPPWLILEIVNTFRTKRAEIERTIALYERKIEQARRDLSAVNTTLRLFELAGDR